MLGVVIAMVDRSGGIPDATGSHVEVVSMSGTPGVGAMAFRAVDKVVSGAVGTSDDADSVGSGTPQSGS